MNVPLDSASSMANSRYSFGIMLTLSAPTACQPSKFHSAVRENSAEWQV
jgi:hypothetical protein